MPPCLVPSAGPVLLMGPGPRKGAGCPEEPQGGSQHPSPFSGSRACLLSGLKLPAVSGRPRNGDTQILFVFPAAKGPHSVHGDCQSFIPAADGRLESIARIRALGRVG